MKLNGLDYSDSSINFSVKHLFSSFHGNFSEFDLKIDGDTDNLTDLKANLTVDISTINTHIQLLNKHLMEKEQFFNVKKYPKATFISTKIEDKGDNKLVVLGNLTIKDITKEITIDVDYVNKNNSFVINFHTHINREIFHLRSTSILDRTGILISNRVNIEGSFKFSA